MQKTEKITLKTIQGFRYMRTQFKNALIGLFMLGAIFLLMTIIFFLHPKVGDMKQVAHVKFANVNKINIGTRVLYAGKPIGEVVAIHRIADPRGEKPDINNNLYAYELTLKYDSHVQIFQTDEITVTTSGLLGEKSINIIPKKPNPGVPLERLHGPKHGDSTDPIEKTFHDIGLLTKKAEDTLQLFEDWFSENSDTISEAVEAFKGTMVASKKVLQSIHEHDTIGRFTQAADNFTIATKEVADAARSLNENQVFENLATTVKNFKKASYSIDNITNALASGHGTLARLIHDDEVYLRVTDLLTKANTTMNDVNQYGMLFNLNKSWQRLRLQKAESLANAKTPAQLRTFFETEVDEISTAMERLGMVLSQAEANKADGPVFSSDEFKKNFRFLLDAVNNLHSRVSVFNDKLSSYPKKDKDY